MISSSCIARVARKRIRQLLTGTKKIAVNLSGEITSTAGDRAF
jgi:hypothetical protein